MTRQPDLLVLVCNADPARCRWRPPGDLQMALVEAHFDIEDGHDPNNIKLELVAWCHHCDAEMTLFRTQALGPGRARYYYLCPTCRRTRWVIADAPRPAA